MQHEKLPVSVTQIMPASINTPFFDKAKTRLGVKPFAPPPLYDPRTVAEAIRYASEHDARDIIVGGAGKMLIYGQRLSPKLMDRAMLLGGFRLQRSPEERDETAPNDLWGPAGQYNRVDGDYGKLTFHHSLSTWLDTHPAVKAGALLAGSIGAGVLLGARSTPVETPGTTYDITPVTAAVPAGMSPAGRH